MDTYQMDSNQMAFPRRPIETELLAKAREEARQRSTHCERTEEEVQEDMRTSELKVARMICQARRGVGLRNMNKWRLWIMSGGRDIEIGPAVPKNLTLQMDRTANVITLTGLEILPKVGEQGGKTIVGTLDVHANGFAYATSSPGIRFHFLYTDVKQTFYRVGDEKMAPLLHFHLHHPVKVGEEMRQHIQFQLVQIEKEKGNEEVLKNFVHKVERKWSRHNFGFSEVHKSDEFQGNLPSKAPTVFGITFRALVGLVDEPFVVAYLNEIEIVSLRLKPEVIDMTIVFQDFERDLVHINSIPIASLDVIKDCCNYEVYQDLDWDSIVKGIADSPREFIAKGGWSYYDLEDPATADLYQYYDISVSEESLKIWD